MRSLILQVFAIFSVRALENPIPSSFLQPRNFNPHPYEVDASKYLFTPEQYEDYQSLGLAQKYQELSRKIQNTGPIQFPENYDTEAEGEQKEQQLEQQRRVVSHIMDKQALIPHPYEQLALNYRSQQLHRYSGSDDQSTKIFSALANHGVRVQNNEFQRKHYVPQAKLLNRIDVDYNEPLKTSSTTHDKKHYRFSYAVKDRHSGDDFSHTQKQENGAVHGSYKVQLPDGRLQTVKYTADDVHGYRAEVSYDGEPHVEASPAPTPARRYHHKSLYPQLVKQVEINSFRHTVTPTPYLGAEYNIRAPARGYYPSTTAIPQHYY